MRLLFWIANTSMTGSKNFVSFPLTVRSIELNIHKLIHVLHNHHVAVQLNNPVILLQGKGCEFAPAIVEAGIIGEIFMNCGKEVLDLLFRNFTDLESAVTFWGESVCVEGNERIF